MAQATCGNGTLYVAEQNARQLLRNFSYARGSTLHLSEDLSYDKNGNITQVTDLAGGPRSKTLGYDALNRLTSATAPALWGTETYAYDPLNNIRQRVTGTQTTTYHYDSHNRLSSLTGTGATSFSYDPRGNVTSNGGVTLTFDQNNQLLSLPGASYAYDASGRRVKKTVSGVDTYYFYSQAGDLLHQWEPATNKTTNFYQLGRRTIARGMRVGAAARTVIYSYTDAQNTPLMRADAGGAVTATFGYTPYGRIAIGGPANGAGYTGHVNDPESGLVYMQARYYDPVVGRFLSVDPVGAGAGSISHFGRYTYANNNPVMKTDPTGKFPKNMSGDQIGCEVYRCETFASSGASGGSDGGVIRAGGSNIPKGTPPSMEQYFRSDDDQSRINAALAVVDYYGMDRTGVHFFYRIMNDRAVTLKAGPVGDGQITVGPNLFDNISFGLMGAVLAHELEAHWKLQWMLPGMPERDPQSFYMREVQAYRVELSKFNQRRFGLTPEEVRSEMDMHDRYYDLLTSGNKDMVDHGVYKQL